MGFNSTLNLTVLTWRIWWTPNNASSWQMGFNSTLSLTLLTWRIWWATNNASRWQIGFSSAFKGLKIFTSTRIFFFFASAFNSRVRKFGWFHTSGRTRGLYINHQFRIFPPELFAVLRIPNEIYPLNQQNLATVIDIYPCFHLLSRISFPEKCQFVPSHLKAL